MLTARAPTASKLVAARLFNLIEINLSAVPLRVARHRRAGADLTETVRSPFFYLHGGSATRVKRVLRTVGGRAATPGESKTSVSST